MLGVQTESFVVGIGTSDSRSITSFTALGFGVFWTVTVFNKVEMWIVRLGGMSWPAGRVREYP